MICCGVCRHGPFLSLISGAELNELHKGVTVTVANLPH